MKNKLILFAQMLIISMIISCSSPIKNYKFYANKTQIEDGDSVTFYWQIENSPYAYFYDNVNNEIEDVIDAFKTKQTFYNQSFTIKPDSSNVYYMKFEHSSDSIAIGVNVKVEQTAFRTPSDYIKGRRKYKTFLELKDKKKIENYLVAKIYNVIYDEDTKRVRLYVQVLDRYGNQITDIDSPEFLTPEFWDSELVETIQRDIDYKIQHHTQMKIKEVKIKENRNKNDIAFAIDYNASLGFENHYKLLQDAYNHCFKFMNKNDMIGTTVINHKLSRNKELTPASVISQYLPDFSDFSGGLNLFNGMNDAIAKLEKAKNDKVLVVFTHFKDDYINNKENRNKLEQFLENVRERKIRLYVIGYVREGFVDQELLNKFYYDAGARVYPLKDINQLESAFEDVMRSIKGYYEIEFETKSKRFLDLLNVDLKIKLPTIKDGTREVHKR